MSTLSGSSTLGRMGSGGRFASNDAIDVRNLSFGQESSVRFSGDNFESNCENTNPIVCDRALRTPLPITVLPMRPKHPGMESCRHCLVKGLSTRRARYVVSCGTSSRMCMCL